ncbi:MAG TPA: hypothetical protein VFP56_05885 [Candidatus Limnocylindrales bacterium]|nr:hypothetical protein [Candidatus Limnocylindrales bacterium]
MRIDRRLLGWGMFFIIVGAIPLATRAGLLDPELVGQWPSLWPLLLIGWGFGLLLRRTPVEWIGGAIAAVVFGIMAGGLLAAGFGGARIATGCGGQSAGTAFASQSGAFAGSGRLSVELSCGSLTLRPTAGSSWSISGTETDGRAPRVDVDGSTVSIDSGQRGSFLGSTGRTDWTIDVPTDPQVDLGLTINAGQGSMDLAGARLGAVSLTVNAGSANLVLTGAATLGDINATVNAGSAVVSLPTGGRSADLSLNAGSLVACLPPGAPLRVEWSGALGSNDLDEAGLTKVDSNTWESPDMNVLSPLLDLRVSANAGSFSLDRDGTCDA